MSQETGWITEKDRRPDNPSADQKTDSVRGKRNSSVTDASEKRKTYDLADAIPEELKKLPRWLCWRLEIRDDEETKVPYQANGSGHAKSTDPATWTDFQPAVKASERFDGLGLALGDGLCGIDLDDCRDPETGEIASWAENIIERLDSYTELSPSGEGVHILLWGELPGDKHRRDRGDGHVELYDGGRYFTTTGEHLTGTPTTVEERQDALDDLYCELFPEPEAPTHEPVATGELSDAELLERMFAASNGHRIKALFDGDISGYSSPSEADLALCCHLAFWTAKDRGRMDQLFRRSGLYREKWQERADYRNRTIDKAIQQTADVYTPPGAPKDRQRGDSETAGSGEEIKQAERLIRLVEAAAEEFFTCTTDNAYVRMPVGDHRETWPVHHGQRSIGKRLRQFMIASFRALEGKPPSSQALSDAASAIDAICAIEGEEHELHNRFAWQNGTLYVDLGTDTWQAVEIDAEGWRVTDEATVYFRRYAHVKPQADPKKDGNLSDIFELLNVEADDDLRLLLQVYLVSAYLPQVPRPILVVAGPQGSAKSTFMRTLRMLTDPSATPVLSFPRDIDELVQVLSHNAVAFFDNITKLPIWLSDTLCRASTGEGFSKRQLYTDDADVIYQYRRAVGFNGITNPATRPDLLDRSLIINLERIPETERRPEDELEGDFERLRPQVLGAIFTALSDAIRTYDDIDLDRLPRMADFAKWGAAISEALGYGQKAFLDAYFTHVEELNRLAIERQPFAAAILALLDDAEGQWQGTASVLLEDAKAVAIGAGIDTEADAWPGSARWASTRLEEASANLQAEGVEIERSRPANEQIIGLKRKN